jgi:hypothetical protein
MKIFQDNLHYNFTNSFGSTVDMSEDAHTQMKLFTGGKATVARQSLICVSVTTAIGYGVP